jgi:pimeloyl-ACP methyl ester carboxylesterase
MPESVRFVSLLCVVALPLVSGQCAREGEPSRSAVAPVASGVPSASATPGPLVVEPLEGTTPPVYVLRGGVTGKQKLVFLHGMCGHGLGYAQSFQRSAAQRGTLIAPQADVSCGNGPWARWSKDIAALDRRITATFRTLGHPEPIRDIIVIGYSQGATRAEALAREYPDVYTRLVVMGGPYAANPRGLESLRALVAMAGERDRRDLMQASARSLAAVGVPATFLLIPEATHGSMGPHPEETMDDMLTWLSEHERPARADASK